jgi:hypothetical protein
VGEWKATVVELAAVDLGVLGFKELGFEELGFEELAFEELAFEELALVVMRSSQVYRLSSIGGYSRPAALINPAVRHGIARIWLRRLWPNAFQQYSPQLLDSTLNTALV